MQSPIRFSQQATDGGRYAACRVPLGYLGLPLLNKVAPFHSLVAVGHASVMNEVLRSKDFERGFEFDEVARLLGSSVLTERGQKHKELRAAINHAFVPKSVKLLAAVVEEEVERVGDAFPRAAAFDLRPHMHALTLRILCRTMFDMTLPESVARTLDVAVTESGRYMYRGVFQPWRRRDTRGPFAQRIAYIRSIAAAILRESDSPFLDALRAARVDNGQRGLTHTELIDEVCDVLLAGHITTANLLTFMFHALARRPQWQITDPEPCHRVWQESLRLYPTAAFLARHALVDTEIAGERIPRGTMFIGVPYAIQRNPLEWGDPRRFDPERFRCAAAAQKLVAFGTGVHVCLGKHLATLEGLTAMRQLFSRFRLSALDDRELTLAEGILVEPSEPALIRVS
jgi:cytochrome P450